MNFVTRHEFLKFRAGGGGDAIIVCALSPYPIFLTLIFRVEKYPPPQGGEGIKGVFHIPLVCFIIDIVLGEGYPET